MSSDLPLGMGSCHCQLTFTDCRLIIHFRVDIIPQVEPEHGPFELFIALHLDLLVKPSSRLQAHPCGVRERNAGGLRPQGPMNAQHTDSVRLVFSIANNDAASFCEPISLALNCRAPPLHTSLHHPHQYPYLNVTALALCVCDHQVVMQLACEHLALTVIIGAGCTWIHILKIYPNYLVALLLHCRQEHFHSTSDRP